MNDFKKNGDYEHLYESLKQRVMDSEYNGIPELLHSL